jgi:hypothetical protein
VLVVMNSPSEEISAFSAAADSYLDRLGQAGDCGF